MERHWFDDVYHTMLSTTWPRLFAILGFHYLLANLLFACLYALGGECISGARPGHFEDLFFFSVHTLSTTGYGTMSPATLYANIVATFEVMVGVVAVAIFTGLAFAKFSQPRARVEWSRCCVVRNYDGVPTLMLRMANRRRNQVIDARLVLNGLIDSVSVEGERMRRFVPMRLLRDTSPLFALSWTAMHPIDEQSPLYGRSIEELTARNFEILATFVGTDGTMNQTVHARQAYSVVDLRFGHRFVDIIETLDDGRRVLRHGRFHDTEPVRS